MKVGFVQTRPELGNVRVNLDNAVNMINKVEADLLVLPELFSTGYFFPDKKSLFQLAEPIPASRTVRTLKSLAKRKKCGLIFGMAEKHNSRCYNSSVYISPRGEVHLYRKLHLFYKEQLLFSPGNLKLRAFPFYEYKIGMMICFDWIFPEVCRTLVLSGANLICHPSNLVLHLCQDAMITRGVENWVFTITANRVGSETAAGEKLTFTGASQITGLPNKVLVRAGKDRPAAKVVDIDLSESLNKNPTDLNGLMDDRRPEFYTRICRK